MRIFSKLIKCIGFKRLVKFSNKRLDQLNIQELGWLVSDFLEKRYDRFDISALEEFLNEEVVDNQVRSFQKDILELESKLLIQKEEIGLWSPKAIEPLKRILERINQEVNKSKG